MFSEDWLRSRLPETEKPSNQIYDDQPVRIIRLEKAFSWQQSYNRYPFYLAQADPQRTYSFEEVYSVVFQSELPGAKKDRASWVRNTFGLTRDERSGQITIKGIGLFEQEGERYRLSHDAVELGNSFSEDRHDDAWLKVFARILARNCVRTRCILYYLGQLGYLIEFPKSPGPNGFFGAHSGARLISSEGQVRPMFGEQVGQRPRYAFTPILQQVAYKALGPFWVAKLAAGSVQVADNMKFVGALSKGIADTEPSSDALDTYLKQTLSIFKDLGMIAYMPTRSAWGLDCQRGRTMLVPEILEDLFPEELLEDGFLTHLREVYDKLADADGLASVRQMRDWVGNLAEVPTGDRVRYFNERVAHYMDPEQGRLAIARQFHAQASPEDCLFFDLEKEYVAFVFLGE